MTSTPRPLLIETYFLPSSPNWDSATVLKAEKVSNPLPYGTLGDLGFAVKVTGPEKFPPTVLVQRVDEHTVKGIMPVSVRVYRFNEESKDFIPVWSSAFVQDPGLFWVEITRPGTYVPIGLPGDPVTYEALRELAKQRQYTDRDTPEEADALTKSVFQPLFTTDVASLEALRRDLARSGIKLRFGKVADVVRGRGGLPLPDELPKGLAHREFLSRLAELKTPPSGLPEEALFYRPELLKHEPVPDFVSLIRPPIIDTLKGFGLPFCTFFSNDWTMYHGDQEHSGNSQGCSNINSTNVNELGLSSWVPLEGAVLSIPTVVGGKVYVGTTTPAFGGTFYKIDLSTGRIEAELPIPVVKDDKGNPTPTYWGTGIASSPAVVGNFVYISTLEGKVYCLDANTLKVRWVTDIRSADKAHKQPLTRPTIACWSSPLVVTTAEGNQRVYVGSGLGEDKPTMYGMIHCLGAATGDVVWLFCTNQFTEDVDNSPNVIPDDVVGLKTLPQTPKFTPHPHPRDRKGRLAGASVWSSCAYDNVTNRIFVGTGNPDPDGPLPNPRYSSGVLALNADDGTLQGFFQPKPWDFSTNPPTPGDSYRSSDLDVDIPGSPTIFTHGDKRVIAVGSKNGSFFLLDAHTMEVLVRRQLLPYVYNDPHQPIETVDPNIGGENHSGVYGSAAVHYGLRTLYVGIGGYVQKGDTSGIDSKYTPFVRALKWDDLTDAWLTSEGQDHVTRYDNITPLYQTPNEVGLSSPAVVNDVVFVTTNKVAIYAFHARTGLLLWSDHTSNTPVYGVKEPDYWAMGPAIYGDYVLFGVGTHLQDLNSTGDGSLYIYSRQPPSYGSGDRGSDGGRRKRPVPVTHLPS